MNYRLVEEVETGLGLYHFRGGYGSVIHGHAVEFKPAARELAGDLLPHLLTADAEPWESGYRDGVYIGMMHGPRRPSPGFDLCGEPYDWTAWQYRSWREETRKPLHKRLWVPEATNSWRGSWESFVPPPAPPSTYEYMPIDAAMSWVVGAFEMELAAYVSEAALRRLGSEMILGPQR